MRVGAPGGSTPKDSARLNRELRSGVAASSPGCGNRVTQGCRAGRGGQRGREQVALAEPAAEGQQYVTLLVGFHSFGDDLHADRAAELDDGR